MIIISRMSEQNQLISAIFIEISLEGVTALSSLPLRIWKREDKTMPDRSIGTKCYRLKKKTKICNPCSEEKKLNCRRRKMRKKVQLKIKNIRKISCHFFYRYYRFRKNIDNSQISELKIIDNPYIWVTDNRRPITSERQIQFLRKLISR